MYRLIRVASRRVRRLPVTSVTRNCQFKYSVASRNISYHGRVSANYLMKTRTTQSINVRRASSYPAHTPVGLPALSPTMEKGNLKSWEKEEGAKLEEGDLLATVETDKATMDFETPQEGYLAKILMPEGSQEVPLGKLVCIIVENEEDVAAFKNYTHEDSESASASTSSAETQPASQPSGAKQPEAEPATSANYPEHEVVKLPALSPTVESSTLKEWAKKVGDKIEEGDVIANVETDKATIEWTYEDTDVKYLAKILIPEGTSDIAVGAPVCVFVESPEHIGSFKDFTASAAPKTATPVPPAPAAPASKPDVPAKPAPSQTQAPKAGGRVFATPFAKTVAKKKGVDISQVTGTGPGGRILAADVQTFVPTQVQSAPSKQVKRSGEPYVDIPVSSIRKVIAKRLLESKQTIPHYYLSVDINMDEALNVRAKLNDSLKKDGVKVSVNDFIIKACAAACRKVPEVNSAWMESFIRQFNTVDVSVAVQTSNGLITPIVFNADVKGLVEISQDVQNLAGKARDGKLKPEEFQGGSFTVSNLGMFGIQNFSAVINPPQACILAIGGSEQRFLPDKSSKDGYKVANVMSVTLSCDHRVVDGAIGATWLQHFKQSLETPAMMLL